MTKSTFACISLVTVRGQKNVFVMWYNALVYCWLDDTSQSLTGIHEPGIRAGIHRQDTLALTALNQWVVSVT